MHVHIVQHQEYHFSFFTSQLICNPRDSPVITKLSVSILLCKILPFLMLHSFSIQASVHNGQQYKVTGPFKLTISDQYNSYKIQSIDQ